MKLMLELCRIFKGVMLLALIFAAYPAGHAEVVINEIHYDPPVKKELVEFVELHNSGEQPADLSGWRLSGAVEFVFPAGTALSAGGYVVVAENPAALLAKFGVPAAGPWTGRLDNDGEKLELRDPEGRVRDEVNYRLGFPWPTVGSLPGYSIELMHPGMDNDLGGSWRASAPAGQIEGDQVLVADRSFWKYRKGTSEASIPRNAWRALDFDDTEWETGRAPIGYGEGFVGTALSDMQNAYSSVFLRKSFEVTGSISEFSELRAEVLFDDGFVLWLNGVLVAAQNTPGPDPVYNATAQSALESLEYHVFVIPSALLRPGENVLAVQAHNSSLGNSSDFFIDVRLSGRKGGASGPTPGARNAVYATEAPPQVRQVEHWPEQPRGGEEVRVTAKITDPNGMGLVQLEYQVVEPGDFIESGTSRYGSEWTAVAMRDDGSGGDVQANDSVYSVLLPGELQRHRRLIRYRLSAEDADGVGVRVPYADDPQPNFAYFVYDGVPAWRGAVQPGSADPNRSEMVTYGPDVMNSLPVYHLLARAEAVQEAQYGGYGGDQYRWNGALVYDGKVYDHIRFRARGGVWRYAMGKNMWKFDFNRGHWFTARNNFGEEYGVEWDKLNLGACIQQGDFLHRGEQGMFESVGFRLFNLAGVEGPMTHFVHFRVIDGSTEVDAGDQYEGDFWGLYLAVEQMDGRFLDQHGLPDGNLYKMESGTGELNNQGRTAADDKSDLNRFLNSYERNSQTDDWWRANLDLNRYYRYRVIVEGIHHYDIGYGKNYFYYLHPETGQWSVHPWDLDLTWADNMYGNGEEPFRARVLANSRTSFNIEYDNTIRELRDLLFNTDQAYQLIDEYAAMIRRADGGPSFVDADRAMWDYNPILRSRLVNSSKAGNGRFYQAAASKDFDGMVDLMKRYVVKRGGLLDGLAADSTIPTTPQITYAGPDGFPADQLSFRCSPYSGSRPFAAMQWRVGEFTPERVPPYVPDKPRKYEIEGAWVSSELPEYQEIMTVPPGAVKAGSSYRARVRVKDQSGRWSHWSAPVEFNVAEAQTVSAVEDVLRVTEVMYAPLAGSEFEFIELYNASEQETIDLSGGSFIEGVTFVIPAGTRLGPGEYLLVTQANPAANFASFRAEYGLDASVNVIGPWSGNLNNAGEHVVLESGDGSEILAEFDYGDSRGWPASADGAGHSIVVRSTVVKTELDYSAEWRASTFIGGSPGRADPPLIRDLLINELMAATDVEDPELDSNDWIEVINAGGIPVDFSGWYLSDDEDDLRKWAIPAGTLPAGGRIVFDEVTGFNSPPGSGFGLSRAGERLFLSHFPSGGQARVADSVDFQGQVEEQSWGRWPDGGEVWHALVPTRGAANVLAPRTLAITEVMYRPAEVGGIEEFEFIELSNLSNESISLADADGAWRVSGGTSLVFPANTVVPPGGTVVVVPFNPIDTAALGRFENLFGPLPESAVVLGPIEGPLSNSADRISIERPEPADATGLAIAWIIVDEIEYADRAPWPESADGEGDSLHRVAAELPGRSPLAWSPGTPTPGSFESGGTRDSDGDGMPDDWELAHGLNPNDLADAPLDADQDGLNNLGEFRLGGDPRDPANPLYVVASSSTDAVVISFFAVPGAAYSIQARSSLAPGTDWEEVRQIPPVDSVSRVEIEEPRTDGVRFYRVVRSP